MGWSDTEELICVQENATVFVYDLFGKEKETYSIGDEASVTKIVEAKVFQSTAGTGVAVMTTSGRIFLKQNSSKAERKLPDIPSKFSTIKSRKRTNLNPRQTPASTAPAGISLPRAATVTVCWAGRKK